MLSKEQIAYLLSNDIGTNIDLLNLEKLTDDEYCELEDAVTDRLRYCGFDENDEPTKDGIMCESIIDVLTSID